MTMPYTAIMSVEEAIIAALNADPAFVLIVGGPGKVYSSLVAEEAPRPYILLGNTTEDDAAVVKRSNVGFRNGKTITIYSGQPGKDQCNEIYKIMRRVMHQQKLPMNEGRMVRGALRLVMTYPDPVTGDEIFSLYYDVHTRH